MLSPILASAMAPVHSNSQHVYSQSHSSTTSYASSTPTPAMSPRLSSNPVIYDDVVRSLEKLGIPGRTSPSDSTLDAAFSYTWPSKQPQQEYYDVIDSFAPRRPSYDMSPTSSASSEQGSFLDAFVATRSRVIRVSSIIPVVIFDPRPAT